MHSYIKCRQHFCRKLLQLNEIATFALVSWPDIPVYCIIRSPQSTSIAHLHRLLPLVIVSYGLIGMII